MGEVTLLGGTYSWGKHTQLQVALVVTPNLSVIGHNIGEGRKFREEKIKNAYKCCYKDAILAIAEAAKKRGSENITIIFPLQGLGNMGWDPHIAVELASQGIQEGFEELEKKDNSPRIHIVMVEKGINYLGMKKDMTASLTAADPGSSEEKLVEEKRSCSIM